jgi:cytochrome c556
MTQRLLTVALFAALSGAFSLPAYPQAKPETVLRQRQGAMTLQAKYFYPIRAMAQGKTPYDANVVTRNVGYLDALARMPWDGFTPATKDLKSGATAAVFTDTAKFKEAADRYQAEVTTLADLARKGGGEPAIKAQILAVDKSCGTCHDTFRERQ